MKKIFITSGIVIFLAIIAFANPKFLGGFFKITSNFQKTFRPQPSVNLEGTLEIMHTDNFLKNTSSNKYFIRTKDKETVQIRMSSLPSGTQLSPGTKMRLQGNFIDGIVAVKPENFRITQRLIQTPTQHTLRILVIPFAPPECNLKNLSREEMKRLVFDGQNSIKRFYERNSYGSLRIIGDIYESTVDVPPESPAFQCHGSYPILQPDALAVLDPLIDFRKYDYYIFIDMKADVCNAHATIGKRALSTHEGEISLGEVHVGAACLAPESEGAESSLVQNKEDILLHEFGHNLELYHEGQWVCANDIPLTNEEIRNNIDCYGRYTQETVMGTGSKNLAFLHRKRLNIRSPIKSNVIRENGDYLLSPLRFTSEVDPIVRIGERYQELQIPIANGYYSLEYRMDEPSRIPDIQKAVSIRFIPTDGYLGDSDIILKGPYPFALVAESPAENSHFEDRLRGISIEVLELRDDGAFLRISVLES